MREKHLLRPHLDTSAVGRAEAPTRQVNERRDAERDAPNSPPGEAFRLSERPLSSITLLRASIPLHCIWTGCLS
jgi:hypothetical protein